MISNIENYNPQTVQNFFNQISERMMRSKNLSNEQQFFIRRLFDENVKKINNVRFDSIHLLTDLIRPFCKKYKISSKNDDFNLWIFLNKVNDYLKRGDNDQDKVGDEHRINYLLDLASVYAPSDSSSDEEDFEVEKFFDSSQIVDKDKNNDISVKKKDTLTRISVDSNLKSTSKLIKIGIVVIFVSAVIFRIIKNNRV